MSNKEVHFWLFLALDVFITLRENYSKRCPLVEALRDIYDSYEGFIFEEGLIWDFIVHYCLKII